METKICRLDGLDCASCAAKIERAITKVNGVKSARVNFLTSKLTLEYERENFEDIIKTTKGIIKKYEPRANLQI